MHDWGLGRNANRVREETPAVYAVPFGIIIPHGDSNVKFFCWELFRPTTVAAEVLVSRRPCAKSSPEESRFRIIAALYQVCSRVAPSIQSATSHSMQPTNQNRTHIVQTRQSDRCRNNQMPSDDPADGR
jgi:hypothetical protein